MMRIEVGGGGTIDNATGWSSTARLSAAGSFSFAMPAADPAAALAAPMATVSCYVDNVLVGAGIIDDVSVSDGVLTASGDDLTRELAVVTVDVAISGPGLRDVMTELAAYLPSGWTFVNSVADNATVIQVRSRRDSLLNTIATACEVGGCTFAVSGRTLTISDSWGTVAEGVTPTTLRRTTNSYDVVNKVYCYGAGDGSAALTMYGATVSLPTGYALDGANSCITHTASPYSARERRLDFKEIAPQANTDAGVIAAKNNLVIAGYNALKSMATPIITYAATVLWEGVLAPMQRLRLAYKSDALTIDATLVITEATVRAQAGGVVTTDLTLEAQGRRFKGDAEILAGAIKAARVGTVYPQLGVGLDTVTDSYRTSDQYHAHTLWVELSDLMTQGNFAQLAVDAVGWPVAPGVTARVPASYTYSVNGSASAAVPAGKVDITALLYSGTTKRPLARLNSVDLWAAPETYSMQAPNSALGGSQPTLFALGATFYIDANMIPGNNLGLYNGSYVRTKALEHVWITITGSAWVMDPTPFTYSSVTYYRYFISATDGTDTGLFYAFCVYRPGGVPTSMGPEAPVMGVASAGYYGYRNDRFDATVTMRVTNKYIAQAN